MKEKIRWLLVDSHSLKNKEEINQFGLQEKNNFNHLISLIIHELTQPLMVIQTYCGGSLNRLENKSMDHEQMLCAMKNIKYHADILNPQIHEIKNFMKILANVEYHDTNIHDVINESLALFSSEFQANRIEIKCCFYKNIPLIKIDKIQIKHALLNLMKYSIERNDEYTFNKLSIKTKIKNARTLAIYIKNKFRSVCQNKAQSNTTNTHEGSKMRLFISRALIEPHGGELFVNDLNNELHFLLTLNI